MGPGLGPTMLLAVAGWQAGQVGGDVVHGEWMRAAYIDTNLHILHNLH